MSDLGDALRAIPVNQGLSDMDEITERLEVLARQADELDEDHVTAAAQLDDERSSVEALRRELDALERRQDEEKDELQTELWMRRDQVAELMDGLAEATNQRRELETQVHDLKVERDGAVARANDLEVQARGAALRLQDAEELLTRGASDLGDRVRTFADEMDGLTIGDGQLEQLLEMAETADQLAHDAVEAREELARERDTWTTAAQVAENSARAATAEAAAARAAQEQAEDVLEEAQRRLGLLEADEESAATTSASDALRDLSEEMRRHHGARWADDADRVRYLARLVDDQWAEQTRFGDGLQRQAVDQAALLEARGQRIAELLAENTTLGERIDGLEGQADDAGEQRELLAQVGAQRGAAEERARQAQARERDAQERARALQTRVDELEADDGTKVRRLRAAALVAARQAVEQKGGLFGAGSSVQGVSDGVTGLLRVAEWLLDTGERWPEDGGPVMAVPIELDEVADWLAGRDLFVWREDGISVRLMPTGLSVEDGQLVLKGLGEQYADGTTTGIVFAGASGLERTHAVIDRSQLTDETTTPGSDATEE